MPDTEHYHLLVKAVARALRRQCGISEGTHLLVAVSGGADSVALLRVLVSLKDRRRWNLKLTVGHVQHHLREDDAEGDARFVEALAGELELPYLRADLDLSEDAGNVEDAARRGRYQALGEMARGCGAGFIATAHHGDDQLETLLMRMMRGAGTQGMRGIAWQRPLSDSEPQGPVLIRPMLAATRPEVLDYLKALNQPWREDHTNADLTRWRARLRAEVLPVLEQIRPGAGQKSTQFADHLRGVHQVLDGAIGDARQMVERDGGAAGFDRAGAKQLESVVLSGLLRELLTEAGVPGDKLGTQQIGQLVRVIKDGQGGERSLTFSGGVTAEVTWERVQIIRG